VLIAGDGLVLGGCIIDGYNPTVETSRSSFQLCIKGATKGWANTRVLFYMEAYLLTKN